MISNPVRMIVGGPGSSAKSFSSQLAYGSTVELSMKQQEAFQRIEIKVFGCLFFF